MKFYSTNNKSLRISFKDVLLTGMPTDKGLYMPEYIPDLSDILDGNTNLSFKEIGCLVSSEFIHGELSKNDWVENFLPFINPI